MAFPLPEGEGQGGGYSPQFNTLTRQRRRCEGHGHGHLDSIARCGWRPGSRARPFGEHDSASRACAGGACRAWLDRAGKNRSAATSLVSKPRRSLPRRAIRNTPTIPRSITKPSARCLADARSAITRFYPPPFLLLCLPLALLPYIWALALWLGATGYAYWRAIRMLLPGRDAIFPVLGFPAFLLNAEFGQNGVLTAALLGSRALLLSARPIVAGCCLGALVFKPHLGVLIPALVLASGAWRSLLAAVASAAVLAGASWVLLGAATWQAFFASNRLALGAMEQGAMGFAKMQSVFGAARISGLGVPGSYAAQALAALLAGAALVWIARRTRCNTAPGMALLAATPLASPFLLTYDLAMLGLPMAWLAAQGLARGFRPWEKSALLAAYFLPLLAASNALELVYIPWTPVVCACLLALLLARAATANPVEAHGGGSLSAG